MNCKMCNSKLPMPTRQNPLYAKLTQDRPKAVVFDLDMTLFDNSQRFTDARRAGLVDKAGKPKIKGMMSKRQAFNKRNKFLYSNKELAKDVVIPGATQLVSDLKNDGYTIIYLTARPEKYQEQTIQQLESNGFPLFRDTDGNSLVFSKPADKTQVPAFKGNKVRELLGNYKVEMVFDDNKSNLEEIAKLGIPGLYASLSDHVRHNPHQMEAVHGPKGVFVQTSDPDPDIEEAYRALPDPDDEDGRTLGDNMNPMGPLPNPNFSMPRSDDMAGFISLGPMRYDAHPDGLMSAIFNLEDRKRYGSMVPIPLAEIKMAYEEGSNENTGYINETDRPLLKSSINDFLPNPLPKPKRKKLSNGKYRKEPKKTYVNRMMETKKMKTDFPDRKQRYAVTMTLVEKFYGKTKANPDVLPNFLGFGKKKEKKAGQGDPEQDMKDYKNFLQKHWQGEPFEFMRGGKAANWKKLNPDAHPNALFSAEQIGAGDSLLIYNALDPKSNDLKNMIKEQKAAIKKIPTGYKPIPKGITIYIGQELDLEYHTKEIIKDINAAKKLFKESDLKILKMPGESQSVFASVFAEVNNLSPPKKTKGDIKAEKIIDAIYRLPGGGPLAWPLVVVNGFRIGRLEHLKAWSKSEMSNKYKKAKSKTNPGVKLNPAHPSKVEKAKKLYKHMNGKEPAKIEKKKLDLGDVWYQVGEGGCWQIGYISGKDNGRDDQKYTHVFNEETKDGNFPKLYATMPENGKPMLIITGGTWKIKTDATGTAWIYD